MAPQGLICGLISQVEFLSFGRSTVLLAGTVTHDVTTGKDTLF